MVVAYEGNRRLWSARSNTAFLILYPAGLVLYDTFSRSLDCNTFVLRTLRGKILWTTPMKSIDDLSTEAYIKCAGGSMVLYMPPPPNFGVSETRNLSEWPAIRESEEIVALDIHRRREIWRSNVRDVGEPVWTNGRVFLTFEIDYSRRAMQRAARGTAPLPVWLVERRVRDRRFLWRCRSPGYPPLDDETIVRARPLSSRRLDLRVEGNSARAFLNPFARSVERLRLTVPILEGSPDPPGQPVVYLDHDWFRAHW